MLRKILSLVFNCEKNSKETRDRQTTKTYQGKGREYRESKPSTKMDTRHFKETLPDPWW
jgi:hypothetical protein